jgi:hypothetical protein
MQPRSAGAPQADLHGSSGAKERRHQDDKCFHNLMFIRHRRNGIAHAEIPLFVFVVVLSDSELGDHGISSNFPVRYRPSRSR